MNLIVTNRIEPLHIRFEARGQWCYGDALQLAYSVKAAAARHLRDRFLLDLLQVAGTPGNDEKFLICDRLRRIFAPPARLALLADPELVDSEAADASTPGTVAIALFPAERDAFNWLMAA
jgi:hypothetical protein